MNTDEINRILVRLSVSHSAILTKTEELVYLKVKT